MPSSTLAPLNPSHRNEQLDALNRRTAQRWTLMVVGFLSTIIAVNLFIAYLAVESRTTILEDNPYERGLAYEQKLSQLNAAAATGVTPSLEVLDAASTTPTLQLQFPDKTEHFDPSQLSAVRVHARHPAGKSEEDVQIALARTGGNTFQGPGSLGRPGLWLIEVSAVHQDQPLIWAFRLPRP